MVIKKSFLRILLFFSLGCCSFCFKLFSQPSEQFAKANLAVFLNQSLNDDWKMGKYQSFECSSANELLFKFSFFDRFFCESKNKVAIGCKYEYFESNKNRYFLPTDNIIQSDNMLKYLIGWEIDPYVSFSVNTQITESFRKYQNSVVPTSKFRDPITTQQGLGFASILIKNNYSLIETSLGATTKQIRAKRYTLLTDNRQTKEVEKYRAETGVQMRFDLMHKFAEKVEYRGKFDAQLNLLDKKQWICNADNEIKVQLWKIFGILIKLELTYNEQVSKRIGYKQSTKFGIITSF